MSRFTDWFRKNNDQTQSQNPSPEGASNTVTIFVQPGNEIEVPMAEAQNLTLVQLFRNYAETLGIDANQCNRIIDAGRIVGDNERPVAGRAYRATADSFVKGN